MKSMYVILAHQRSGTHLLQSLLRSSNEIFQYDEVLYPALKGETEDLLFFEYYLEEVRRDPNKLLFTDNSVVDSLFEGYFQEACRRVSKQVVGFDIKLDQFSCFPRLSYIIPLLGIKIIHLVRGNYIARIASHEAMQVKVAEGIKSDSFHFEKFKSNALILDIEQTIAWADRDYAHNSWIKDVMIANGGDYMEMYYEDISGPDYKSKMHQLFDFLNVERCDLSFATVRQGDLDLSKRVSNYVELEQEIITRGKRYLLGDVK